MTSRTRRLAALAVATAALGAAAAPSAMAADHTQKLNIGAELVKQQPGGKPWIVNLLMGADFGMSDATVPAPLSNMKFSFTSGAKVHPEAFKVCSEATVRDKGPGSCPRGSKIGSGTANAVALETDFPADVTVFNGPKKGNARQIIIHARAIQTVQIVLVGTLRTTRGKYGYVLDVPVPPIQTVGGTENNASITTFNVKVGGYGRLRGKRVPFVEAPTRCTGSGWPFLGEFRYTDGGSGSSAATIGCTLRATND